jgi:uncharacterized repeat protein (TIGR01451 family)
MVWEVYWNLVDVHGFNQNIYDDWTTGGNNLTFQLVMDGMKLQPCSPGMVDGRDAILAADLALTGGENRCEIWEGFAKRGLGYSADQGSPFSRTDGTEAFDMPGFCTQADATVAGSDSPDPVEIGSALTYVFQVANNGVVTATNTLFTETLDADTDYASSTASQGSCSEAGGEVTCSLGTINPGDSVTVTVVVTATQVGTVNTSAVVSIDEVEDTANNTISLDTTVELDMFMTYLPAVHKP